MQEGRKVVGDTCPKNTIHATTLVEIYRLYEILTQRTCLARDDPISLKTYSFTSLFRDDPYLPISCERLSLDLANLYCSRIIIWPAASCSRKLKQLSDLCLDR